MPTRTARTTWNGGLQDGTGTVSLVSSGVGSYEVSFPKRAADDADGTTSPEELIAAAHSACFAMQFSAMLGSAGGSGQSLEVRADVSLGPDPQAASALRASCSTCPARPTASALTTSRRSRSRPRAPVPSARR